MRNQANIIKILLRINSQLAAQNRQQQKQVQDLQREVSHLRQDNRTDPLTGLTNRRGLHHLWKNRSHEYAAILMVDVDHFKQVNDTYGHGVGDLALIRIAAVIERHTTGIRTGGDELLGLVRKGQDPTEVAEKIHMDIAKYHDIEGNPLKLTVSIGIAHHEDDLPLSEALIRADSACYISKRNGRNQTNTWKG